MKKLVSESLQEFMDMNEAKKVVKQTPEQKAKEAIAALKQQLADVKKPGKMKDTKVQKDAKIKELEGKIAKWEAKIKKVNESFNSLNAMDIAKRIENEVGTDGDGWIDPYAVAEWLYKNWKDITGLPLAALMTNDEDAEVWPDAILNALDILEISDYDVLEALDRM